MPKYEDKTALINEIYDILHKPEHEYLFIRMMSEIIARYVMIARRAKAVDALEAEPIKHGRWIVVSEYPKKAECSYCGYPVEHELVCWWDYCPNCGAKMDEVEG